MYIHEPSLMKQESPCSNFSFFFKLKTTLFFSANPPLKAIFAKSNPKSETGSYIKRLHFFLGLTDR